MDAAVKFLLDPWVSSTPAGILVKVVDILVVSYIIYRALLTLRGTRGLPIAIGFVGIYLIYIYSGRFGLQTLSNLFDAFFSKLSIFVSLFERREFFFSSFFRRTSGVPLPELELFAAGHPLSRQEP